MQVPERWLRSNEVIYKPKKSVVKRALWWFIALYISFAFIVYLFVLPMRAVLGQENHAAGHDHYVNWTNQNTRNCCNGQDCGSISDDKVRDTKEGALVEIEGKWCPIKPWMYLKTGNAPNWSTAHVCVQQTYIEGERIQSPGDPCDRLLCFQPKPMI